MIIPKGVDHRKFWDEAKNKNIKISSRFVGVSLNVSKKGSPSWLARVQKNGMKRFKRFTLSERGEIAASKFYKRYSKNHESNPNNKTSNPLRQNQRS